MKQVLVAPSLLSSDFSRLKEEVQALDQAGADWFHWDIMDGHFVDNLTLGPCVLESVRPWSKTIFDVHLMISHPLKYIRQFAKAGADRVTFHVECDDDTQEVLDLIKEEGLKAGLSVRPKTELSQMAPFFCKEKNPHLDLALIMTVEPGFGGQDFLGDQLKKVKDLRIGAESFGALRWIQVDGGVNGETSALCKESGANVLVSGSFIFAGEYAQQIKKIR